MSIYVISVALNCLFNGKSKTCFNEIEVNKTQNQFKRLRKFPRDFNEVNEFVDFLPTNLPKRKEYGLCTNKYLIYMFGEDRDLLMKTWKTTFAPNI